MDDIKPPTNKPGLDLTPKPEKPDFTVISVDDQPDTDKKTPKPETTEPNTDVASAADTETTYGAELGGGEVPADSTAGDYGYAPKQTVDKKKPKKIKLNKKSVIIGCAAAGVVLLLLVGFLVTRNRKEEAKDVAQQAIIQEIIDVDAKATISEGTIEYKDGDEWKALEVDGAVKKDMEVRAVGGSSKAEITLSEGSIVRLAPNSSFKLTNLRSNDIQLEIVEGYTYNRVNSTADKTFVVKTKNGVFKATGTAFKTANIGDGENTEVYDGKVFEESTGLTANEGDKLLAYGADDKKIGKIEKLNIETVKADTFTMWCRDLDSKNNEYKDDLGFLTDITVPELTISEPANNSTIEVDSSATQGTATLKGTTDKSISVTVAAKSSGATAPNPSTTSGSDGAFTITNLTGPIGTVSFDVTATDKSGNKTTKSITFTFKRKTTTSAITASATATANNAIKVSWTVGAGLDVSQGVYVVYNITGSPTVESSDSQLKTGSPSELTITAEPNKTYYIRVCRYTAVEKCDNYSNQVTVKTPL